MIIQQLAERTLRAVQRSAELDHLPEQLIEPADGRIEAVHDLLAPVCQRSRDTFEIVEIFVSQLGGALEHRSESFASWKHLGKLVQRFTQILADLLVADDLIQIGHRRVHRVQGRFGLVQ